MKGFEYWKNYFLSFCVASFVLPFSIFGLNTQIFSLLLLLFLFLKKMVSREVHIKINELDIFFIFSFIFLLSYSILINFSHGNNGLYFLYYLFKLILLYFLLGLIFNNIENRNINFFNFINFSIVFFCIFCTFQLLFSDFHDWSLRYFGDFRTEITEELGLSGHSFRNLGWNAFLYASHGVTLAFSALFLIVYRVSNDLTKGKYFIYLSLEFFCIVYALLSGRSSIPIVFIYLFLFIFYKNKFFSIFCKISMLCFFLGIGLIYLMNDAEGGAFLSWLFEPFLNVFSSSGKISNSVNDTASTYTEYFATTCFSCSEFFFGEGVYYRNNKEYWDNGLVGSDSGFIRMFYFFGFFGFSIYIIIFIAPLIYMFFSIKKLIFSDYLFYLFILYGFIFLFKSEWIYQNYFLIIYFTYIRYRNKFIR